MELLALINGRIMELVRLPCPATRIHQPDNSGHVTPGINWTDPQIEFWAKERRAQKEIIRILDRKKSTKRNYLNSEPKKEHKKELI